MGIRRVEVQNRHPVHQIQVGEAHADAGVDRVVRALASAVELSPSQEVRTDGCCERLLRGPEFLKKDDAKDSIDPLELDGVIEYKAVMQQGDVINFSWETDGGEVYYDFHAHDEAFGEEFFSRYEEGEGTSQSGSVMAAYDGQHGWFWLNLEGEPTTITLDVSGFFDEVVEIDLGGY